MSDSVVQHFIDLGDGVQRELWYSVNLARKLAARHGSYFGAMSKAMAEILPDLIYEGLAERSGTFKLRGKDVEISVDNIGEAIPFSKQAQYIELVQSAMAGLSLDEFRAKAKEAEEEAKRKNAESSQTTAP